MAPPQKRVARGQAKQRNLPLFDAFTDGASFKVPKLKARTSIAALRAAHQAGSKKK